MINKAKLYDVTLRDGNHALRHSLDPVFIREYCLKANLSESYAVEIGHGNGLGASSFLVGKSKFSDEILLTAARESLTKPKLAVHSIPGFATIDRDLKPAIELGVDLFRIATHVSEATLAKKHIEFLLNADKEVQGVLMMSHMIEVRGLIEQVKILSQYGVNTVVLMDSAGYFFPNEVKVRIETIKNELDIKVGFHAHNNLGVAVTNAITAINSGATMIDGAAMGLGAGAGNAQLENIVTNLNQQHGTSSALRPFLDLSSIVAEKLYDYLPATTSSSIESGLNGVFSGYAPQVKAISAEMGLNATEIWENLAKRKIVAGQESMIREIAEDIMNL
jgi:4-hydroxy 2-oxovalerate aldolase